MKTKLTSISSCYCASRYCLLRRGSSHAPVHLDRTDELAADDAGEEELQGFARGRRTAVILQTVATVVGGFLPVVADVVYLGLSLFFFVDPPWIERVRRRVRNQNP